MLRSKIMLVTTLVCFLVMKMIRIETQKAVGHINDSVCSY